MRVAVGTTSVVTLTRSPPTLFGEVADDGKARDDLQRLGRGGGEGLPELML